ncbi:unnamed protein product [Closterium sp. NIES-65]|nr:unnamed protein product [Closterium sp. NIES-65]
MPAGCRLRTVEGGREWLGAIERTVVGAGPLMDEAVVVRDVGGEQGSGTGAGISIMGTGGLEEGIRPGVREGPELDGLDYGFGICAVDFDGELGAGIGGEVGFERGGGGGVERMWEGELCDCFGDSSVATQTVCCPCITFGQNMAMAGFGSCAPQALIYCALTWGACSCAQLIALCSTLDFFSSLGILLYCLGTSYPARFRTQTRQRFNIQLIALCSTLDFFSSLGILLYCLGTSYPARFRTQTRR